jgi:hypothetical protein
MLRPAEQIKKDIERYRENIRPNLTVGGRYQELSEAIDDALLQILNRAELRDGDEATGLEILAGLPREEQKKLRIHVDCAKCKSGCPSEYGLGEKGYLCWPEALRTIFVYRSGKWEVKGEK